MNFARILQKWKIKSYVDDAMAPHEQNIGGRDDKHKNWGMWYSILV
jgi:hypothetical protein